MSASNSESNSSISSEQLFENSSGLLENIEIPSILEATNEYMTLQQNILKYINTTSHQSLELENVRSEMNALLQTLSNVAVEKTTLEHQIALYSDEITFLQQKCAELTTTSISSSNQAMNDKDPQNQQNHEMNDHNQYNQQQRIVNNTEKLGVYSKTTIFDELKSNPLISSNFVKSITAAHSSSTEIPKVTSAMSTDTQSNDEMSVDKLQEELKISQYLCNQYKQQLDTQKQKSYQIEEENKQLQEELIQYKKLFYNQKEQMEKMQLTLDMAKSHMEHKLNEQLTQFEQNNQIFSKCSSQILQSHVWSLSGEYCSLHRCIDLVTNKMNNLLDDKTQLEKNQMQLQRKIDVMQSVIELSQRNNNINIPLSNNMSNNYMQNRRF